VPSSPRAPTRDAIVLDHKECDARRKRGGAIDQRVEDVGLRALVINVVDGGLQDRHVTRRARSLVIVRGGFDAFVTCGAQVLGDRDDY